jgi:hypothetical protein
MTASKLRIDLAQGVIEAEGTESFVLAVYNDFKERMTSATPQAPPPAAPAGPTPAAGHTQATAPKPAKAATNGGSKTKPRETLSIIKDLDLSKGKHGRLKDFYGKYATKTNYERNLVFVYFLQHEADIAGITENHIFTCYRDVNAKLPGAFRQSLFDTASAKGWINTADMANVTVTVQGLNHLEHDLTKKAAD